MGPISRKNMEFWSSFKLKTALWHPKVLGCYHFQNLWVVDNLLLNYVGLPLVLDLTVHLVIFVAELLGGIIPRIFFSSYFFSRVVLHTIKIYGWGGGPKDFIVAPVQIFPQGFGFDCFRDWWLGLGLGLDNYIRWDTSKYICVNKLISCPFLASPSKSYNYN